MSRIDGSRCQLHSQLARPGAVRWLRIFAAAIRRRLRLRTRLRDWWRKGEAQPSAAAARLGSPSRFAAGSWVRIREPDAIFATLDRRRTLRGLAWVWQQWPSCGTVHRVLKPVRRMMDDAFRVRAISATVLLDTVPCGGPGGDHGCGRDCPMMYRDEWLEAAVEPPSAPPEVEDGGREATVRSVDEIMKTLDAARACDGLMFMPEMAAYAGQRFRVRRRVAWVLEGGVHVPVGPPVFQLEGLYCSGAILDSDGPCDRACRLLWHENWLRIDGTGTPAAADHSGGPR